MNTPLLACSVLAFGLLGSACTQIATHKKPAVAAGTTYAQSAQVFADGDIPVPKDYRSWPRFLTGIDKPDAGQVRDIYINSIGSAASAGDAFPHGSVSVMEIWKAKRSADGALIVSENGNLVKDELSLVFLMAKQADAAASVDPALKTGDWVYAGYSSDRKTPAGPTIAACRSCHLTVGDKDWIFRYDEYFDKRAGNQ